MSLDHYLPEGTRITFELEGTLPIFRERYVSSLAGTVVLKGFFTQTAHMELLDGTRYRTLSPIRDERYLNQMAFRVVRLPEKTEVFRLLMPIKPEQNRIPRLRYTTTVDDQPYVFRQVAAGQRGFELWDGMEMQKLVKREPGRSIISDLTILVSVPTLFVLLFPWLDNQTLIYRQP